jgi:hypothetical protein
MSKMLTAMQPVILGLLLISATAPIAVTQENGCEWLSAAEPFYSDAMGLMQILVNRGVMVRCILGPSTSSGMFDDEHGAAIFRTDIGEFDVHFLPPSLTFNALLIQERIVSGRYLYSFEGTPKAWRANLIDSPRALHFIRDGNRLVETQDATTAARLVSILDTR